MFITSLKPLINYLMILQSISKDFGIHYKHLGFDNAETLRDAIRTLEAAYSTVERMVQDARSRPNKTTLKPEGPEIMKESMKKKTDCGYLYYTHPRSFYPVPEGKLKI